MKNKISGLILFLIILSVTNCSRYRYLTPVSTIRPDSTFQITDEEIMKAFEKKPQLVKPLNVAVYNSGFNKNSFADSLRNLALFQNVFEIPLALIEGEKYYHRRQAGWHPYYNPPPTTNIKQLRLTAAEGKADLLIFCGISHYYKEKANFLAYSYALLLTGLFVPGLDAELITEVDLFFIDVRNGLLYASYHDEVIHKKKYVTIYYSGRLDPIKEKHVRSLIPGMVQETKYILAQPEFYIN